eukprot:CAMPEP_0206033956 /NCGR_PEP_ID=MMETSP1466-20131121/1026_1 /ASSEMBLY_ACC=CAM_ASM_001126 /TAXON_ID=44452 /ORGANISM="Pavlova gyrans, Strain CCMP608" /LENGTH=33 /DNA_ID= /DNA_START= /DNA_END= /DNA_ORIENTATION=
MTLGPGGCDCSEAEGAGRWRRPDEFSQEAFCAR